MSIGLVEISGLPCSGKSYFCDSKDGFLNKKQSSIIKVIMFEVKYILLGLLFLKFSVLRTFLSLCFKEKVPLKYKIKILRNVIKKFGIHSQFRNVAVDGFIDEGISHIPFNFLNSNTSDVIDVIKPFLAQTNVKYIKAESDFQLKERLQQRGHDRLKFLSVSEFIALNRSVEVCVLSEYPNVCLTFEVVKNA
ncbi:hypothetical protein [Vibrio breoganii]|uniref:hypothetical protein n=1 Tax=Vibrio breoganii TaxID=553239 RepID=UPI000C830A65|nr:hypothetical protein [Vibrio breoganii]PMK30201.1 hypothetical protein BCU03_10745 [Vibrio breoganii]